LSSIFLRGILCELFLASFAVKKLSTAKYAKTGAKEAKRNPAERLSFALGATMVHHSLSHDCFAAYTLQLQLYSGKISGISAANR
jgi:hypothetical protein